MSDFDAPTQLRASLAHDTAHWSENDLAEVQGLAREIAGTAETIRLTRALEGSR